MGILLLHSEDQIDGPWGRTHWDTVVDLGRAPRSFYEEWSRRLQCPVFSIFDLAREVEDFRDWRGLLEYGRGQVVDDAGIDWWEVIGIILQQDMQDVRLAVRLADSLAGCGDLSATRPSLITETVRLRLGCTLKVIQSGAEKGVARSLGRYRRALSNLSFGQLRQVAYDKYDPQYVWRRNLAPAARRSEKPVILLPTAYSNVTKTALQFAEALGEHEFLMVVARESAKPTTTPKNVATEMLASYARPQSNWNELRQLEDRWSKLEESLEHNPEFKFQVQTGILSRGKKWLRWGLAVRDAWNGVFARRIVGCLSADDTNPYTRIPLLIALEKGIPGVACHHGALDIRLAFKSHPFGAYLAKGEMERDYLDHVCGMAAEKIRVGSPSASAKGGPTWSDDAPWIVVFTEPYESDAWRVEAIYRELFSRLVEMARSAGKTIVIKLHPFESLRHRRRLLKSVLSRNEEKLVLIKEEPLSPSILDNTWCAVTVESTAALECALAGIPVFLCGWLRHAYAGYAPQYARFGVGQLLKSADELREIPARLRAAIPAAGISAQLVQPISASALSEVLCVSPPSRLR